jgi:hypothetical protein
MPLGQTQEADSRAYGYKGYEEAQGEKPAEGEENRY